jgi:hypothetical protein
MLSVVLNAVSRQDLATVISTGEEDARVESLSLLTFLREMSAFFVA